MSEIITYLLFYLTFFYFAYHFSGLELAFYRRPRNGGASIEAGLSHLTTNHPELEEFCALGSDLTDSGLHILLSQAPNLKKLTWNMCKITGETLPDPPASFQSLALLELDLLECWSLSRQGFLKIVSYIRPETLTLFKPPKHINFDLESVALELRNLESLDIFHGVSITEKTFTALLNNVGHCLKKLRLESVGFDLPTSGGLLTTKLPKLENLSIDRCYEISEESFIAFLNIVSTSLRKLEIDSCKISLSSVDLLTSSFPKLDELKIEYCSTITERTFISFLNRVGPSLKRLKFDLRVHLSATVSLSLLPINIDKFMLIGYNYNCENEFITFLNLVGASLKKLDFSERSITLSAVDSLTTQLTTLQELNMSCCSSISSDRLYAFLNRVGPGLRKLNLNQLELDNLAGIDSLTAEFPNLRLLDIQSCFVESHQVDKSNIYRLFCKIGNATVRIGSRCKIISALMEVQRSYPNVTLNFSDVIEFDSESHDSD